MLGFTVDSPEPAVPLDEAVWSRLVPLVYSVLGVWDTVGLATGVVVFTSITRERGCGGA